MLISQLLALDFRDIQLYILQVLSMEYKCLNTLSWHSYNVSGELNTNLPLYFTFNFSFQRLNNSNFTGTTKQNSCRTAHRWSSVTAGTGLVQRHCWRMSPTSDSSAHMLSFSICSECRHSPRHPRKQRTRSPPPKVGQGAPRTGNHILEAPSKHPTILDTL